MNFMDKNRPIISVLMPVHNGADFLEESVESILSQTFCNFELIISDDGSTDCTSQMLKNFAETDSRVRLSRNYSRQGVSSTLNQAARLARGSLLARMDADDWSCRNRFEVQLEKFEENPDLAICGSNVIHGDEEMRPLFRTVLPKSDWDIRCAALFENPFAHPSVMIKAEVFRQVGGYDEQYSTSQDYELWIRLLSRGQGCNSSVPLVMVRRHRGSISYQKYHLQLENTAKIQKRYSKDWLGISEWQCSRYRDIHRYLYREAAASVIAPSRGGIPIRDALAILSRLEQRFPENANARLNFEVIGRCIWSAFRKPRDFDKVHEVFLLVLRRPISSFQGLLHLVRAASKRREFFESLCTPFFLKTHCAGKVNKESGRSQGAR